MTVEKTGNSQTYLYLGLAAVIIVILFALWLLLAKDDTEQAVSPPMPAPTGQAVTEPEPDVSIAQAAPEIVQIPEDVVAVEPAADPQPEVTPEPPLPALDQSDAEVKQRLLALNWRPGLANLFVTEEMLRNLVVLVDNIAQGQLAAGHSVVQPLAQRFADVADNSMQLNEQSFARYTPYVQLIESVPPQQLIALFNRYEPLLQQAFSELGYPDDLFKNRMLQAIDALLATPQVEYPLQLVRPSVMYQFADPALEQLPAAQKQMLRLGPDNQQRLKAVLQRYRSALQQ